MKRNIAFLVACIFYTIVTILSLKLPLFWDNILFSSKTAVYFFNGDFSNLILPPNIDSGHPPFWGKMIATVWKVFGKSLTVSHLIMLPILIILAWNFIEFAKRVLSPNLVLPATLLLLIEPTLLAHSTMVSLEILLVCGFFGALNTIIKNKTWQLSLWCLIISIVSIRGIFLTISLFTIYCVYLNSNIKKVKVLNVIKPFLLAAFAIIIWYLYHWLATGYFFQSSNSGWAVNNTATNTSILIKNLIYTVWRFFDFGRWIILVSLIPLIIYLKRSKKDWFNQHVKLVLLCFVIVSSILILAVSITKSPPLHRYYIVSYLFASILFLQLLSKIEIAALYKKLSFAIVSLSLITGHLWVYPDYIAQGWDGSLAHLPFFKMKDKMLNYIESENISRKDVLTDFPLINANYYSDLGFTRNDFIPKHKAKMNEKDYILQSNICNGFSDGELIDLKTNWILQKEFKKRGVYLRLYKNSIITN